MNAPADFLHDVRHSLRQFRKNPAFTAAAVAVLGIGLGANAAIFSVVDGVLLHGLPYADPSRLVVLYERGVNPGLGRASLSYADYLDWSAQSATLDRMAIAKRMEFNLAAGSSASLPERIDGAICSWTLLPALGNAPLLGRLFTQADDQPGAPRVALIGYSLWQTRFGGSADILSRRVRLDGEDYSVIGVMPKGFSYPRAGSQIWVPVLQSINDNARTRRGWRQFDGIARLRPGAGIDQARLELDGIAQRIRLANPGLPNASGAEVYPLEEFATHNVRAAILTLFGSVGCVLLIACVNIANLLLARASRRQREMAIRAAVGASRGRIVRQLLAESSMLAAAGAAFGVLLASFMMEALAAALPALDTTGAIQSTGEIHLDAAVFLFTTLAALAVGLVVGIVPALQISRTDLTTQLKDGNRSVTAGRAQAIFRNTLVSAEVAISLALLVSAGLLLRSFGEVRSVRSGVRTERVLTAGISLPAARYPDASRVGAFEAELRRKLGALPGVSAAELSSCLPIDGYCGDQFFSIDGRPHAPGQMLDAFNWSVTPGFFHAIGIPILHGRGLTEQDVERQRVKNNRYAAVISDSMAKTFWPDEDPIGQTIYFGDGPDEPRWEIVGICGDVIGGLDRKPRPSYFVPLTEWRTFYAVIATDSEPEALTGSVRRIIASLDADVPAFRIRTMTDIAESSSANRRLSAFLLGLFAATALVLAAIGLYSVLSYLVSQRIGEIGIRLVLGATAAEVRRLILRQGMRPVLAGLAAGLIAAALATHLLQSLLFGVTATDPATFAAATLLLCAVALLACFVPAWRAGQVDPAVALRNE